MANLPVRMLARASEPTGLAASDCLGRSHRFNSQRTHLLFRRHNRRPTGFSQRLPRDSVSCSGAPDRGELRIALGQDDRRVEPRSLAIEASSFLPAGEGTWTRPGIQKAKYVLRAGEMATMLDARCTRCRTIARSEVDKPRVLFCLQRVSNSQAPGDPFSDRVVVPRLEGTTKRRGRGGCQHVSAPEAW